MKILLIDPGAYLHNFGLRMVASQIEKSGHEVAMFFSLGAFSRGTGSADGVFAALREHVQKADLIGLSVYTNYYLEAVSLTEWVKSISKAPVVWGGVHPTVLPEDCLKHADFVCQAEGEDAIAGLLESLEGKRPFGQVPNLWYKEDGIVRQNPVRLLERDLDSYPFPAYVDLERTLVADLARDTIRPLTEDGLQELTRFSGRYYGLPEDRSYHGYLTLTTRGCPYRCAYCINNALNTLYKGKGKVFRFRSVDHVIGELEQVKERFPFINFVHLFDDNLCARPLEDIERFNQLYKRRIGLPFKCNFHPNNATEEKIDLLVDAGLVSVEMGIESGSKKTNREIYQRPHSNENILKIAGLFAEKYPGKVVSYYDVIMDNPYEGVEDVSQTIRLIQEMPRPFRISHFSLTFFPGTALFERARRDGIVRDFVQEIVRKKNNRLYADQQPYAKLLISISPFIEGRFSRALVTFLAHPWFLRLFNSRGVSLPIFGLMKLLIRARTWYNTMARDKWFLAKETVPATGDR